MTDLLPCPFCGSDAAELTLAMREAWVSCPHCEASSGMSSRPELAIKNWNARHGIISSPADKDCQEIADRCVRSFFERHPQIRAALKKDFSLAKTLSHKTRRAIIAALNRESEQ